VGIAGEDGGAVAACPVERVYDLDCDADGWAARYDVGPHFFAAMADDDEYFVDA